MPAGTYRLGLSAGSGATLRVKDDVVVPSGQSTIEGEIIDHSGRRVLGYLLIPGAVASAYIPWKLFQDDDGETTGTGCLVSLVAMTGVMVAGMALATTQDEARVSVSAGVPASALEEPTEEDSAGAELERLKGVTVSGAF